MIGKSAVPPPSTWLMSGLYRDGARRDGDWFLVPASEANHPLDSMFGARVHDRRLVAGQVQQRDISVHVFPPGVPTPSAPLIQMPWRDVLPLVHALLAASGEVDLAAAVATRRAALAREDIR